MLSNFKQSKHLKKFHLVPIHDQLSGLQDLFGHGLWHLSPNGGTNWEHKIQMNCVHAWKLQIQNSQNRCVPGFGMYFCFSAFLHSSPEWGPSASRVHAEKGFDEHCRGLHLSVHLCFPSLRSISWSRPTAACLAKNGKTGTKTKTLTAVKDLPQLYFHFPSMQKTRSGLKGCTVLEVGITAMKYHCPNT